MAAKCICPYEDSHNAVVNNSKFLTLDQAAAVASGFKPCCASWLKSKEFNCADPNKADEVSLFRHELQQEVASGELESRASRLNRTERLIPRQALEQWLTEWNIRAGFADEESKSNEPLVVQRAQAIRDLIREHGWKPQQITVAKKKILRSEVKKEGNPLMFTKATFDKAWSYGVRQKMFSIKDREKYLPRDEKKS